jgi:hypothetical protein
MRFRSAILIRRVHFVHRRGKRFPALRRLYNRASFQRHHGCLRNEDSREPRRCCKFYAWCFGIFPKGVVMLYTIAVILLILWLLGLVTSYTIGGFIHVLLVIAIVLVLLRVIRGDRIL